VQFILYVNGGWNRSLLVELTVLLGDTSLPTRLSELEHFSGIYSRLEASNCTACPFWLHLQRLLRKTLLGLPRGTWTDSKFCVELPMTAVAPSGVESGFPVPWKPLRDKILSKL